jgi:acetyl esterase/lipase
LGSSGEVIRLWTGRAPQAVGDEAQDVPTLTVYRPASPDGSAIVICPGGGYGHLAAHEAEPPARWLNSLGVTAFVLKYRLGPRYQHPAPMLDAARAIRFVRANAQQWNLDPKRIGILGFSAGGHLSATISTHFDDGDASAADPIDRVSSRPDLAILLYPVITLADPWAHAGSRKNLLGPIRRRLRSTS